MAGVFRPPYGAPSGPLLTDDELIDAFLSGARTGHSGRFHLEEGTLLVDRFVAVALRLRQRSVLVRTDVPTEPIPERLAVADLRVVADDPPLATVVALQALGLPAVPWALWSESFEVGIADLEATAASDDVGPGHR